MRLVPVPLVQVHHRRRHVRRERVGQAGAGHHHLLRDHVPPRGRPDEPFVQPRLLLAAGQRPRGVARSGRLGPDVVGEAAWLLGPVLPGVQHVQPDQPPEVEAPVDPHPTGAGQHGRPDRHVLVVGLVPGRPLDRELLGRLVPLSGVVRLVDHPGVVALHVVVVPSGHEGVRGVRRPQRRVALVLRVPSAVVGQGLQLPQPRRLRCRVDPVGEPAAGVVLVDVVPEVQHHVQVLFGQSDVRGPVPVLEVLAAHHAQPQPLVGPGGLRPPHRAQVGAGAEPVEVLPAGQQPPHVHVHRVRQFRPGQGDARPHDPAEPLVLRDLPPHRHRAVGQRLLPPQPGPQHDPVGQRVTARHAQQERRGRLRDRRRHPDHRRADGGRDPHQRLAPAHHELGHERLPLDHLRTASAP